MPRSRAETDNATLPRSGVSARCGTGWSLAVARGDADARRRAGRVPRGRRRPATPGATIKVGYSSAYVFDEDPDSVTYWNNIKHEFEAAHPGVTLELQPHGGTDTDEMNAIALQFRSPATTPDVIQLPTTYIGQFESSGYLLALDKYLGCQPVLVAVSVRTSRTKAGSTATSLPSISVKTIPAFYYNKGMLQKAGITVPWTPA